MQQFTSLNYIIDANALSLKSPQGEMLNIRPKTCQLLLVLLKSNRQPVSKQEILKQVWGDTVVDEQVVFQSIKELRKLFNGQEVIKTLPKQGYIWLPDVDTISPQKLLRHKIAALLISVIVFSAAIAMFNFDDDPSYQQKSESISPISGSVIILPTENLVIGNDHSWVRLGMMDQLIQRLPSNEQMGVLQTDYVLQVLDRAGAPLSNVTLAHIPEIFTVSGAELIVSTKLSGSPYDYQLTYTLYRRKSQQKGVLFNRDVQGILDELALLVNSQLGNSAPLSAAQYQADFNDEMLGVAIDLRLEGKFEQAIPLLKSIVDSTPSNLTAQRLLIEVYLATKAIEEAGKQLATAIPIAKESNNGNELTRLLYFNSIHALMLGNQQTAKQLIEEGLQNARLNKDWLFQAYLTELKATIAVQQRQFTTAENLYHESLSYHQVLKCPLGETQSWLFLSELAAQQNQKEKQQLALNKAQDIATQRNLTNKLKEITSIKNKHKYQ